MKGFSLNNILTVNNQLNGKKPNTEEFTNYFSPILSKVSNLVSKFLEFAIGDFKGSEFKELDKFLCDVNPLEEDSNFEQ